MKKAILFEPELLAGVKRISPAVYENYSTSPFSKLEFIDYGTPGIHMYMPAIILHMFKASSKQSLNNELFETFQAGWVLGFMDLFSKHDAASKDPLVREIGKVELMMAAWAYPYYNLRTLIQHNNFFKRGNIIYNTITYQEAQCFEAWKIILTRHQYFNDSFVELEVDSKNYKMSQYRCLNINKPKFKPGLPLDDKDSPIDFSEFRGSTKS